ncbi:hypothetical protein ACVWWO_008595 [Bradyrhizobium sp. F1.13.1]
MESESLLATYAERVHREHTIRTIGGSPQSISTSQSGASLRAFRRVGCVSRCSGGGMSQRKFMGLGGGATASGPGIALASERLANAAAEPAYDDEQEFPLVIANIPATPRQKAWAVGVAVLLIVLAAVIAPFARIQLGQINGFVPVLQTALALAEFITAALLFAQFSIQPQRALLALASGYVFSGSFAFLQTLAFPNGYAPAGLIGDGLNSPAWLYVFWHTAFSRSDPSVRIHKGSFHRRQTRQTCDSRDRVSIRLHRRHGGGTDVDGDRESRVSPELLRE